MSIISKSNFMTYLDCSRKFFFDMNKEEKEKMSESTKSVINQGTEIGKLAHRLYENGTLVKSPNFKHSKVLEETQSIKDWSVLFEGAFIYNMGEISLYCRSDIIERNADGSVNLIEVKSSTKAKDEHFMDLLLQKFILEKNGFIVKDLFVIHINNNYVFNGVLNVKELLTKTNVTDSVMGLVNTLEKSHKTIDNFFTSSGNGINTVLLSKEKPDCMKGSHCGQGTNKECPYFKKCFGNEEVGLIENIARLTDAKKLVLSELLQVPLSEIDKQSMKKIPDSALTVAGGKKNILTELQSIDVLAVKNPNKMYFDVKSVKSFLSAFKHKKVSYMDFETFMSAIPVYVGTRPYQQVPFQFVVYNHFKENITRIDHIHTSRAENPYMGYAKALIEATKDADIVVVFNATFENRILEDIKIECPIFEKEITAIQQKLVDLNVPFAKKWICHKNFLGSSSLKYILETMCPNFSYHNLTIQRGDEASALYLKYILGDMENEDQFLLDLKDYCGLDVLAMLKIVEKIKDDMEAMVD